MPLTGWSRVAAALWGACALGGLAVGAAGPPSWRAAVADGGPGCPLRALTGVACPCCGMTRATLALGAGEVDHALALHPLAPLVLLGTLVACALVATGRADVLSRGRRPRLLLAALAAIWLVRLSV
ncbi:MAG TPA: DUF2752 domain-containing protein [Kofleriaceae bacterium]|nr:DUF2752 domain-containing protein [Kofleriaceae bacterium]